MTDNYLASDFNGQEGTVCFWVGNISVDNYIKYFVVVSQVDGRNSIDIGYNTAVDLAFCYNTKGFTTDWIGKNIVIQSSDFISSDNNFFAMTWSKSTGDGQIKAYLNGALYATASDIGTWATDAPSSFYCKSGPGDFYTNHLALWNTALTDGQIAAIYNSSLAENASMIPELGAKEAKLRFINPTGGNLYVTSLQIRGKRIKAYRPIVCQAFDSTNVGKYGRPGVTTIKFDMPYQTTEGAGRDYANYILNKHNEPFNNIESITFSANKNSTMFEKAVKLMPGDRIHLVEAQTGLDGSFFINGVEKALDRGNTLDVTYFLQAESNVYWLIGTAGYSEIGETTYVGY